MKQNLYVLTISILIGCAVFAGVMYLQSEKWLKQSAVQGCLMVGRDTYNYPVSSSSAQIPNQQIFEECMQTKGY